MRDISNDEIINVKEWLLSNASSFEEAVDYVNKYQGKFSGTTIQELPDGSSYISIAKGFSVDTITKADYASSGGGNDGNSNPGESNGGAGNSDNNQTTLPTAPTSLREEITNDLIAELGEGDLSDANVNFILTSSQDPAASSVEDILGPVSDKKDVQHWCKYGVVSNYGAYEKSSSLVKEGDVKMLCFQLKIDAAPTTGDKVSFYVRQDLKTFSVVSVEEDPARVTYKMQLRPEVSP